MTDYWLTFRLSADDHGGRTYEERYSALKAVVEDHNGDMWPWRPSTSFVAFSTIKDIRALAQACRGAVASPHDLVLLHGVNEQAARFIGSDEEFAGIKLYMDYVQKV